MSRQALENGVDLNDLFGYHRTGHILESGGANNRGQVPQATLEQLMMFDRYLDSLRKGSGKKWKNQND